MHEHCKHVDAEGVSTIKYCEHCNKTYCTECKEEWGQVVYPWIQIPCYIIPVTYPTLPAYPNTYPLYPTYTISNTADVLLKS